MGRFKLIQGKPGPDFTVPWPEPAASPVPFGLSSGGLEAGTDHMRAGGVKQNTTLPDGTHHAYKTCVPACLFDLIADPGEQHDLAADPAVADVLASITARVEAAAATGPPWAWPKEGNQLQTAEYENCLTTEKTGYFEPVLEDWPPPGPPPPPPPSPVPTGPIQTYSKDGLVKCLVPAQDDRHVAMGSCAEGRAHWQIGWVRGHQSLESVYLRNQENGTAGYCLNSGQVIANNTCAATPSVRTCTDGVAGSPKGGNPLGCGFAFDEGDGKIHAVTCGSCLGVDSAGTVVFAPCDDAASSGWSVHNSTE